MCKEWYNIITKWKLYMYQMGKKTSHITINLDTYITPVNRMREYPYIEMYQQNYPNPKLRGHRCVYQKATYLMTRDSINTIGRRVGFDTQRIKFKTVGWRNDVFISLYVKYKLGLSQKFVPNVDSSNSVAALARMFNTIIMDPNERMSMETVITETDVELIHNMYEEEQYAFWEAILSYVIYNK